MRRRPIGKTGLSVSELALGTWGLSGDGYGPLPEAEQDRVIERAVALGITLFETADSYGSGAMERRLGERLPPEPGKVRICTKLGTDRDATPPRKQFGVEYLRAAFERSAERLRRQTIDLVLLHNPSLAAVECGDATGLLEQLRGQGRLVAWGVSAGSAEVARAALAKGARVLSLAYNAFCTKDLAELEATIQRDDVGVLAHSVLAYGLLCGHWGPDKYFAYEDHRSDRWTADELRRRVRQLDALRPAIGGDVLTMRAAALRFVLSNPIVSSAVLGPRSSLQLDQLVREAGKGPPYLSDDHLTAMRARCEDVGAEA
jgi:aryl-alcohol dehydrogenase-like predicted oxidoreductase